MKSIRQTQQSAGQVTDSRFDLSDPSIWRKLGDIDPAFLKAKIDARSEFTVHEKLIWKRYEAARKLAAILENEGHPTATGTYGEYSVKELITTEVGERLLIEEAFSQFNKKELQEFTDWELSRSENELAEPVDHGMEGLKSILERQPDLLFNSEDFQEEILTRLYPTSESILNLETNEAWVGFWRKFFDLFVALKTLSAPGIAQFFNASVVAAQCTESTSKREISDALRKYRNEVNRIKFWISEQSNEGKITTNVCSNATLHLFLVRWHRIVKFVSKGCRDRPRKELEPEPLPDLSKRQLLLLLSLGVGELRSLFASTLLPSTPLVPELNWSEQKKYDFEALVYSTAARFVDERCFTLQESLRQSWAKRHIITEADNRSILDFIRLVRERGKMLPERLRIDQTWIDPIGSKILQRCVDDDLHSLLQSVKELWLNQPVVGEKPEEQVPLREKFKKPDVDPGLVVAGLVAELIPTISEERIRELELAIMAAQTQAPADRQKFVDDVNQLLDTFSLRIRSNGDLYRLRLAGQGYIQLTGSSAGHRGGFSNAKLTLEKAPKNFRGANKEFQQKI